MAERRMFAKTIIDSDAFLDMPLSTQALYFHLSMRADDDGFINNPKKLARMLGSSDDEFKVLLAKKFIIGFESGVIVIKHWKIHNYIQKDRYKKTNYADEMALLSTNEINGYTMDTNCVQDVDAGKDRLELGKDRVSLEIEVVKERKVGFKKPTLEDLQNRISEMNYQVDAVKFFNYYESNGWKVGRNKMKCWKAALTTWNSNNDTKQQPKSFKQQDKEAIDSSIDNYYRMKEQGFNLQEELIKQAELEKKEIYMSLTKQELSKAIVSSLKIDANAFNYETINEAIDLVPVERYMEFYKQILKVDTYGNGIKAVLEISEMFKTERTDNLLVGTHEQAKAMYDKFYYECCAMLDYTQKDRNKTPNDREFFKNMPYSELKRTDGTKTYSKQELYVLNALGGGEWLLDIRLALSSKEIIDKIEKIIKEAVLTKYNNQSQIESKRVQNLIGGIKR